SPGSHHDGTHAHTNRRPHLMTSPNDDPPAPDVITKGRETFAASDARAEARAAAASQKRILAWVVGLLVLGAIYLLADIFPGMTGVQRFYDNAVTALNARKFRDAEQGFSRAIKVDPKFEPAYFGRALAHRRLDEIDEAIADYTTALALKPDRADAHYNRGLI